MIRYCHTDDCPTFCEEGENLWPVCPTCGGPYREQPPDTPEAAEIVADMQASNSNRREQE